MEVLTDYAQAKDIVATLKPLKTLIITVQTPTTFRKHLSEMAKAAEKKFITRLDGFDMMVMRRK